MGGAAIDKVMIVAHPDDEVLWGWRALEAAPGWFVLCATTGWDSKRRTAFYEAMKLYGHEAEILDIASPDDRPFLPGEIRAIVDKLELINDPSVTQVVTHGPSGEYGHPAHLSLTSLVQETLTDRNKLHYFDFGEPPVWFSETGLRALEKYFPRIRPDLERLVRPLIESRNSGAPFLPVLQATQREDSRSLTARLARKLSKLTSATGRQRGSNNASDIAHCLAACYASTVHHAKRRDYSPVLERVYGKEFLESYRDLSRSVFEKGPFGSATAVYESNRGFYDSYPDRKFVITSFLPTSEGRTLSVGCHVFNRFDCYCLPQPEQFETIDLDDDYRIFGSPFKHTTVDLLEYEPGYRFGNIVLFGVLGIPAGAGGDDYSLEGAEQKMVCKVADLLEPGGRVLIAIDLVSSPDRSREDKIVYWRRFFSTNSTMASQFTPVESFETRTQLVSVFRRKV